MKKFTKAISLCLVVILALALTACGGTKTATTFNDQVITKGKLVVGISADYPPYESLDDQGKLVGYDVDMANELAKYLKTEDGKQYEVEFVQMEFANIISAMQTGQVDVGIACFTYDAKRKCLFSDPYMDSAQVVVAKKDSGISKLDDLKGKTVAAGAGTTGYDAAVAIEGTKVVTPGEYVMQFEMLRVNQIDAIVCDKAVADGYVKSGSDFKIVDTLVDESASVIVAEGHDLLLKAINDAVAQFKGSSAATELLKKWDL